MRNIIKKDLKDGKDFFEFLFFLILFLFQFLPIYIGENKMPQPPNIKDFLNKIMQIESSGGTNFNHRTIASGMHEGDQAIGRYGLMPNTIREIINRRRLRGTSTPELQDLDQLDHQALKERIEANPDLEQELAEQLAQHVTQKQMGDEDRAAFAWQNGHNLTPDRISNEQLQQSPYVQKYEKLKNLIKD